MPTTLQRAAALAALIAVGAATGIEAQEAATDPHHPEPAATGTPSPDSPGELAQQDPGVQPGQPGMMGQPMMGGEMMAGMREAMPLMRMHRPMMKIAFAVIDADGDGALSFEETSAIHRRIFNAVDADQGGTVTPEELQGFLRD